MSYTTVCIYHRISKIFPLPYFIPCGSVYLLISISLSSSSHEILEYALWSPDFSWIHQCPVSDNTLSSLSCNSDCHVTNSNRCDINGSVTWDFRCGGLKRTNTIERAPFTRAWLSFFQLEWARICRIWSHLNNRWNWECETKHVPEEQGINTQTWISSDILIIPLQTCLHELYVNFHNFKVVYIWFLLSCEEGNISWLIYFLNLLLLQSSFYQYIANVFS